MTAGPDNGARPSDGDAPFLVLKVGGSLFSEKNATRSVDESEVRRYAVLVADLARKSPGRLAFVTGGGSFGHAAVRDLDPSDAFAALSLTEATFALKWMWARALRAEGALAVPLQLTAMCVLGADGLLVQGLVIRRLLDSGAIPVMSGDCLLGPDGSLQVFSSDRVPEVIIEAAPDPLRVVALTDVPGIVSRTATGARVLADVHPDFPEEAYQALWEPEPADTTRSMAGKLDALVRLAHRGAECVVLKGGPELQSLRFLADPLESWPEGLLYTRIARTPRPAAQPR